MFSFPSAGHQTERSTEDNWDIHIAPCTDQRCDLQISKLSEHFKYRKLQCISSYPPNDTYLTWFDKYLRNSQFTILHKCPVSCRKLCFSKTKNLLTEEKSKFIIVETSQEICSGQDLELDSFFEDYTSHNIHTDSQFIKFIDDVTRLLKKDDDEANESSKTSSRSETPGNHSPGKTFQAPIDQQDVYDTFEIQQNIFGSQSQQHVYVTKSFLSCSGHDEFMYSKSNDCTEMKTHLDNLRITYMSEPSKIILNLKYVVFTVLPTMYRERLAVGLATLTTCSEPSVQEKAVTLLENIIYHDRGEREGLNFKDLENIESILRGGILEFRGKYSSDPNEINEFSIKRLVSLYLSVLCEIVMASQGNNNFDKQFKTLSKQKFQHKAKSYTVDNSMALLDQFIQKMSGKSCVHVQKKIHSFLSKNPTQIISLLPLRGCSTQLIVIFELMKKVFRDFDFQSLTLFYEFVQPLKPALMKKTGYVHVFCIKWILSGLINFLRHRVKQVPHQNIQNICPKAMEIIQSVVRQNFSTEEERFIQPLLFDKKPDLRKTVFNIYQRRAAFQNNLDIFLKDEVKRLLDPLLELYSISRFPNNDNWVEINGVFNASDVLVFIQKPPAFKLYEDIYNKLQDNSHINELKVLKILQNQHIISLLAYQERLIPEFYILEDFKKTNLQVFLINRSNNKEYFEREQLFKFLLDAASALEYCHSKRFIHRYITAFSFFYSWRAFSKALCLSLVSPHLRRREMCRSKQW